MPTTTPLTDAINALTTYSNTVTGESDTTLSDAVATLAAGYGGGYDPSHLKTAEELVITYGSADWDGTHPVVKDNGVGRRGLFTLIGTTDVYIDGTSTLTELHLIEKPSGATSVTLTLDVNGQFAVREYKEENGVITDSIATTSFINNTANVGETVALTTGMTHIAFSLRIGSSGNYTFAKTPLMAQLDFS